MTDAEKLARLWDALAWLDKWLPEEVADMEDKFNFSARTREVFKNPKVEKDGSGD